MRARILPPTPSLERRGGEELLALIPGAERDPLRVQRRELLRPDRDELAVLPLEHVSFAAITRVVLPFLVPMVATLLLITFFPQLVLFLPNLFR